MSRETLLQASFNAGVLSPRLAGRTDFSKYSSAVAVLANSIGIVSGPAVFRPGTVYIGQNKDMTQVSRLLPFQYSTVQSYALEFGHHFIRFYKNRGLVLSTTAFTDGAFASDLADWTNSSSGGTASAAGGTVTLTAGAGYGAINQALSYLGIGQYDVTATVTGNPVTVNVGTTAGGTDIATGTIPVGVAQTFSFTPAAAHSTFYIEFRNSTGTATLAAVSLSTPPYMIDSPFAVTDLPSISFAQDADVLYLALGSDTVVSKTLQRYGHAQWQLLDMSFIDGPYLDTNTTTTTVTPSAATGSVTLTASAPIFAATDVGRIFRWQKDTSSNWGWGIITAFTSSTVVTLSVQSTLTAVGASVQWRLGAFSQTTGYPSLVTFHEGRLVYANTRTKTNFVWFSQSQGYGQNKALFAPSTPSGTVSDSHSIYEPLSAGDVSDILWMSSGNVLCIGTASAEWVCEPGDTSKALSPTNTRINRRTNHGSKPNVHAVRIDGTVMYVQGTGHKVNRFVFNYAKDIYESINLSQLGEHLFQGKAVVDMIYQAEPFQLMWCLMDDGTLNALTFVDSENVGGWSSHTISGADSFVESICAIPSQDNSYNELWMVVRRTVNGATVRYVEVLENVFFLGQPKDAVNVDCSLKYSGAPATTITGLSHLEGETVSILADGANHPAQVVTGGQIDLNSPASTVIAGLYYEGNIETLDFDKTNAFGGSSMGQIRRITEVQLRLFETGILYTGRTDSAASDLNLLEPRTSDDYMDSAPALKSGLFKVETESQWELSSCLKIKFTSPMPGTVSAIMFKAMVNEG
ncbi:MAG TPA: hypothetical protein VN081_03920 [Dongiaceae bacterium]|nr:hypothetical protein [Dongiaceae bacterium]